MRVDEIQILAADVLLPPPDRTVSQWADQNARLLSSESAAEKGEWDTDRVAPCEHLKRAAVRARQPEALLVRVGLAQGYAGEGRVPLPALREADRRLAAAPDAQGRRVARGAARGDRAGFWISGLYSPWRKWGALAKKFLADNKSIETLRE